MSRETGISARVTLNDSDLKKKIAEQAGNYERLLKSGRDYQKRAASEAAAARSAELALQTRHLKQLEALEQRRRSSGLSGLEKKALTADIANLKTRHEAEMAALKRREELEARIAANRERRAKGWANVQDTGMQFGPHLQQYNLPARSGGGRTATGGFTAEQIGRLAGGPGVFMPGTFTGTFTGSGGPGRGATNAGMGMLMLSQTLDDLQYGLKGVVNNIAPLIMSLGGGVGLAGVTTIAAVGINLAVQAWDKLNKTTELATANAEAATRYEQNLAEMRRRAVEQGTATGNAALARVTGTNRSRGAMDEWMQIEGRSANIAREAALRGTATMDGEAGMRARMAINAQADAESLMGRRGIATDRLSRDEASAVEMRARIAANRSERGGLSDFSNRAAELDAELPGLNAALEELTTRIDEGKRAVVDLALEEADLANTRAQEQDELNDLLRQKFRTLITDVEGMFSGLGDTMRRSGLMGFAQGLLKDDPAAAGRASATANLDIMRERGRGNNRRADRMQRALDIQRRTKELEELKFSPEDAAAMATEETDLRKPRGGIRSTYNAPATGLQDLSKSTTFRDNPNDVFGLKEAAAERRASEKSNLAKKQTATGKDTVESTSGAGTLGPLLTAVRGLSDLMRQVVKNTSPTATNSIKPAA